MGVTYPQLTARISGNTAGATALISTGTVVLAGGNNVTISQNANSLTISAGSQAPGSISAGTTSAVLGQVVLSNSNNVTFGLNGSTVTASASYSQSTAPGGIAAGTQTGTSGTVVFSNSNGITFGMSNSSVVTASYTVPTQSNQTVGVYGSSQTTGQSSSSTLDARSLTFRGAGNVSVGLSAGEVVISGSGGGGGVAVSANGGSASSGTVVFSNSNNVSFGWNASTVTASASYSQSTAPGALAAGTQTGTSGTMVFSDSNGISFGMSGSTRITASYTVPTVTNSSLTLSDAATSMTIGRLAFTNSNGLTLTLSTTTGGSATLVGSYTVPTLTNSSLTMQAGASTLSSVSRIAFVDSNGVSFGASTSNNGSITITATVKTDYLTSQSNQALSGSNGSFAFQTATFGNSNGLSFYTTNGSMVGSYTVPTQTNQTLGMYASSNTTGQSSSTTMDARTLSVRGAGIVSVGYSGGELIVSASAAGAADGYNILAAGTQTAQTNTSVKFADSNGISFGMSNSSQITASYTVPTITSLSLSDAATSMTIGRLAFTNSNGLTLTLSTTTGGSATLVGSYTVPTVTNSSWTASDNATSLTIGQLAFSQSNGLTLSLSTTTGGKATVVGSYTVPSTAGLLSAINVSAGTTSNNLSAITFSNSNGISFGLNASTVTASYTVPAVTNSSWTVSDAATSATVGRLAFTNANGLTLSLSTSNNGNHTVVGSYTVPTVTNSSWTASDNATSLTIGQLAFSQSNGLTLSLSTTTGGKATVVGSYTVPSTAGLISAINLSAGTTSTNATAFTFSDSNNVSFGLNGRTVTATATFNQTVESQTIGISNLGNTSGTSGVASGGQVRYLFAGGNNITLSQSVNGASGTVTISAANQTVQTQNVVVPSAGTQTATSGTVVFSDSNGISFGMSGSSRVTASYTVPTVTNSSLTLSDAATSMTIGRLAFTNSNGLTLTLSTTTGGSATLVGSYTVPTLSNSSLTMQAGASTLSSVSRIAFVDSNGVSFGASTSNNGSITITATVKTDYLTSQSNQALSGSNGSFAFQTATFGNLNGLSFYTSNGSMVGSYTVPTQSNQTLGLYASSNTTGQSSSTTIDARTLSVRGAGIISVGYSGGELVVSASAAGAADGVNIIAAGTQTANTTGTIVFSNSNGVEFGMSNSSVVTALNRKTFTVENVAGSTSFTRTDNKLAFMGSGLVSLNTLAGPEILINGVLPVSGQNTSSNMGGLTFNNANGVSFGLIDDGFGAYTAVTASVASQTNQTLRIYAVGNTTGQSSSSSHDARTLSIDGAGMVSVGWSNSTFRISATQSAQTMGLYASSNTTGQSSSTTVDARTFSVRGAGIISVGYSGGELIVSASAAGAADGVNIIAAGTQTANTTGSVLFSNSNNITFGMSNSSEITASYNFNVSAGTTSNNLNAITFSDSNGMSFGLNGSTLTMTAADVKSISAGTTRATNGEVVLSDSNGLSFGMNGNTVTAKNVAISYWEPYQYLTGQNINNASLYLQPLTISGALNATQVDLLFRFSNSASAGNTGNISFALYTMSGSTASRASSASYGYSYNSTLGGVSSATNFNGTRNVSITLNTWAITPGEYLIAFWMSTTSALTSGTVSVFGRTANTFNGYQYQTNSTSGTYGYFMPGIYSTTTNGMPASIQVSEIQVCGNSVQRQPWFAMYGTR